METTERPSILFTGADGFIGRAAAAEIARTVGPVRAGTRRPISQANTAARACDLDDAAQLAAAVVGTAAVVHAAYGDESAMPRQCKGLLEAMSAAGVNNLVYLSSIAVYGEREGRVDEGMAAAGELETYAAAKAECEALVRQWAAEGGKGGIARRAIILRPGIVYGTGSRFWIDKLVTRMRAGAWGSYGEAGEGTAALVHVDDVADVIAQACARMTGRRRLELPEAAALNVVGPGRVSWNGYFMALAQASGVGQLGAIAPREADVRSALAVPAKVWRRVGLPGLHALSLAATRGERELFAIKADYAMDAARELLGFAPRIGLAEGLRRTRFPEVRRG